MLRSIGPLFRLAGIDVLFDPESLVHQFSETCKSSVSLTPSFNHTQGLLIRYIICGYAQIRNMVKEDFHDMQEEARQFKALADPIRLRLAAILAIHGETCVCELAAALDEPEYKVSRHLGVLRSAGLVTARREGAWMHYSLSPTQTEFGRALQVCLQTLHASHRTVTADLTRLHQHRATKGEHCGHE